MANTEQAEKRTVTGSCHCKAISYTVAVPTTLSTVTKCNCTMCQKPGFITVPIPAATAATDFQLRTPADASQVKQYIYRNKDCVRYFCDQCGVQVWGKGVYEYQGVKYEFFSVNLSTVDQPQGEGWSVDGQGDDFDVSRLKFEYCDGLADNWAAGNKKDGPWKGGIA